MKSSSANFLSIIAVVVFVIVSVVYLVFGMGELEAFHMSSHGWAALLVGVGLSVLIGGGLTAILIISRRRGYDESLHEAFIDTDEDK